MLIKVLSARFSGTLNIWGVLINDLISLDPKECNKAAHLQKLRIYFNPDDRLFLFEGDEHPGEAIVIPFEQALWAKLEKPAEAVEDEALPARMAPPPPPPKEDQDEDEPEDKPKRRGRPRRR